MCSRYGIFPTVVGLNRFWAPKCMLPLRQIAEDRYAKMRLRYQARWPRKACHVPFDLAFPLQQDICVIGSMALGPDELRTSYDPAHKVVHADAP